MKIDDVEKAYKTCVKLNMLMIWTSQKQQNHQFHTGFTVFFEVCNLHEIDFRRPLEIGRVMTKMQGAFFCFGLIVF